MDEDEIIDDEQYWERQEYITWDDEDDEQEEVEFDEEE